MKINHCLLFSSIILILALYCIYLINELKRTNAYYEELESKAYALEDKVLYEESMNYKYGFDDGYESAKNEEKLTNWQASILTKGYENGIIKCYYVSSDGKQIEFPLTRWINVEFPLNKWIPKK